MKTGRPPIWNDPEAFDKAVDEYFSTSEQPTWTGLALHLGFNSRKSLWEYGNKPEFSNSVKRALTIIESHYESLAIYGKQQAGPIFALKNFNWSDKQEIEQKTTIKDERIDLTKLTDDELEVLADIQRKLGIS